MSKKSVRSAKAEPVEPSPPKNKAVSVIAHIPLTNFCLFKHRYATQLGWLLMFRSQPFSLADMDRAATAASAYPGQPKTPYVRTNAHALFRCLRNIKVLVPTEKKNLWKLNPTVSVYFKRIAIAQDAFEGVQLPGDVDHALLFSLLRFVQLNELRHLSTEEIDGVYATVYGKRVGVSAALEGSRSATRERLFSRPSKGWCLTHAGTAMVELVKKTNEHMTTLLFHASAGAATDAADPLRSQS